MSYDILIRGGTVYDGSGKAPVDADIAIADGRIVEIGRIAGEAKHVIDAKGLAVAPGFIDIHSHSDYTLLIDPRAMSAVAQGVTLEVIGNCGFGCAPIADPRLAANAIYGFDNSIPLTWQGIGGYLEKLGSRAACHQRDDADAERAAAARDARPRRARREPAAKSSACAISCAKGCRKARPATRSASNIRRSGLVRGGADRARARDRAGRQVLRDAYARPRRTAPPRRSRR